MRNYTFSDHRCFNESTLVIVLSLLIICFSCKVNEVDKIIDDNNEKIVLFAFDNYNIPWKHNLQLSMVKPTKLAINPVLPRGPKGSVDQFGVQFYGSIIYHEDKYKMWYIAMDDESLPRILNSKTQKDYSGLRIAYAESMDGIHWQKPNLGLVEYKGNKDNNLVFVDPPETCGIHLIVLYEPEESDPNKRFKMMLTVAADMKGGSIQTETSVPLFSPDGLHWKSATSLHFNGGVLKESDLVLPDRYFEQGGLYRWNGLYHLVGQQFDWWIEGGDPVGRVMKILRSPDLINWEDAMSYSFRRDDIGDQSLNAGEREEAHLAGSVWNRNNVLLATYGLWHGAERWEDKSMDLGFLLSNDGIHFTEPLRDFVFIERGKQGTWDEGGLLQGQGFMNINDSTYIAYGSWDMTKPSYPPRGGVGLVKIRRDGFGYLAAINKSEDGYFITRNIETHEFNNGLLEIYLNVQGSSPSSPVRIELVDGLGFSIPDYAGEHAAQVVSDGVYQKIEWPNGTPTIKEDFAVKATLINPKGTRIYALYANIQ